MVLIAASLSLVSSIAFLVLYAFVIDIKNSVAANIWVGILVLAFLSTSGVIVELRGVESAKEVTIFAYSLATFVCVWRTVLMVRLARDKKGFGVDSNDPTHH